MTTAGWGPVPCGYITMDIGLTLGAVHGSGSSSPRSPAAGGTGTAAQPGRAGLTAPVTQPAQPSGNASASQQQQKRPPARPGGGAPGVLPRPQQPATAAQQQRRPLPPSQRTLQQQQQRPLQQQRRPDALRSTGQVRGEAGGQAGSGATPTLEQPRRPPPSSVNVFASIMSDMQVRVAQLSGHSSLLCGAAPWSVAPGHAPDAQPIACWAALERCASTCMSVDSVIQYHRRFNSVRAS